MQKLKFPGGADATVLFCFSSTPVSHKNTPCLLLVFFVLCSKSDNSVHSCNGELSSYYIGNDTWNTTFVDNDGVEYDIDVFYATFQNELWVRTIQVYSATGSK